MKKIIYKQVAFGVRSLSNLISPIYDDLNEGGRFYLNICRAYGAEAYIRRHGVWSDPWETSIEQNLIMPDYDNNFKETFEDVTDNRANDIKKLIHSTDKNIILFYSGGIDSTVCLVSILKNFNSEELKKFKVSMSFDSIIENPIFYQKFIKDKIQIIDTMKFKYTDHVDSENAVCITADLGDFIYGTELGVKLYPQITNFAKKLGITDSIENLTLKISSSDTHYSRYKDILISYFNSNLENGMRNFSQYYIPNNLKIISENDKKFGELFYEKIHKNIISSKVPVYTLHDFFWWSMFNMRFTWGALRPGMNYGTHDNMKKTIQEGIVNWYGSKKYQLWSMNNNNNGEKINGSLQTSYKWASRKYIYQFDKNEWYLKNKMKMPSMPTVYRRHWKKNFENFDKKFGIDENYIVLKIGDPGVNDFIIEGITNYKINWI